eukprot:1177293-Pleurochrysis_carterae.AAC.1
MVEGTPGGPYSGFAADLLRVERNMRIRRASAHARVRSARRCTRGGGAGGSRCFALSHLPKPLPSPSRSLPLSLRDLPIGDGSQSLTALPYASLLIPCFSSRSLVLSPPSLSLGIVFPLAPMH